MYFVLFSARFLSFLCYIQFLSFSVLSNTMDITDFPMSFRDQTNRLFVCLFVYYSQEKCEEVAVDGLSDLKETAEVRIRGVKRSLEDDIKFVQDGDNFLNKRRRITDRLQNSFEAFEMKAHDI